MKNKNNQPKNISSPADTTDSLHAGSFQISSEQAKQTLRWLAEDIIQKNARLSQEGLNALSPEEMQLMLHELRVHQVELEIQNEELRRIQVELEVSRARFVDLYDFAPVEYLTVSENGIILEANLTAASQLGATRGSLIKKRFSSLIFPKDQGIYYYHRKALFETGVQQTFELRLVQVDGPPLWALLKATKSKDDEKGEAFCRVVVTDIHERKQAEEKLRIAYAELELRVSIKNNSLI